MPAWIHERAKHILAKNPDMDKSTAFAIATQQSHKLGKSPKGYGTAQGKKDARAKYDKPRKEYKKGANPGKLSTPKLKEARVLTQKGRVRIKEKNFAIPGKGGPGSTGRYPIHDTRHARNALTRVNQYGTPEEKSQVYAAVAKKYPGLSARSSVSGVREKAKKASVPFLEKKALSLRNLARMSGLTKSAPKPAARYPLGSIQEVGRKGAFNPSIKPQVVHGRHLSMAPWTTKEYGKLDPRVHELLKGTRLGQSGKMPEGAMYQVLNMSRQGNESMLAAAHRLAARESRAAGGRVPTVIQRSEAATVAPMRKAGGVKIAFAPVGGFWKAQAGFTPPGLLTPAQKFNKSRSVGVYKQPKVKPMNVKFGSALTSDLIAENRLRLNGLLKIADEDSSKKRSLALAGVAGAAPFAGMIGEQKIIHDPLAGAKGQVFRSMEDLSRAAKAGDVLVMSKPKGSMFKTLITPVSGSEFYHAQPVLEKKRGMGTTADTGSLFSGSDKSLRRQVKPVHESAAESKYKDVVLLRPKKPLTEAQAKAFSTDAMRRSSKDYATGQAVKNWAKDIFVPKIKGVTDRGPQTICEGNICSTVPSMAMDKATGRGVVPGKTAKDVMPADFLRSTEYELVGSKIPSRSKYTASHEAIRKARPVLSRALLGAGMAGTAYGASEDPAVLGGVAGAAGSTVGGTLLANKLLGEEASERALPAFGNLMRAGDESLATTVGKLVTRRVPLLVAGGGLGYLGAKKLLPGKEKKAYEGFALSEFAGSPEWGTRYLRPSYMPAYSEPPVVTKVVGKKKHAFATSAFSGPLGGGRVPLASHLPGFSAPPVKTAGPPSEDREEERSKLDSNDDEHQKELPNISKAAGVISPRSQLTKAQRVGAPKATAPAGPSIAQIAKPIGFGRPHPSAIKSAG